MKRITKRLHENIIPIKQTAYISYESTTELKTASAMKLNNQLEILSAV